MEGENNVRFERRTSQRYFVLSESELKQIVVAGGQAGGAAALNDFLALWAKKSIRNVVIGLASVGSLAYGVLSDNVHISFGPAPQHIEAPQHQGR